MPDKLITEEIHEFLENREFINIATSDPESRPNVAPKFILKVEGDSIYLVDYVIGRTLQNLKTNANVSLSTVNLETLVGYQLNGQAQVINKGQEYKKLIREMHARQIEFSTKRIIEGVKKQKAHTSFELTFPEHVVIFKVKVEEIVEIGPSGKLERKRL